jgi:3-oxoacyl-[acyl-carrier-protein] synthase II
MPADQEKIVITGIGLTAPNGNNLQEYRQNLLNGVSGVEFIELRYVGKVPAGVCDFDQLRYQTKKDLRTCTRAGSIAIYCSNEALNDAGITVSDDNRSRIGIFIGTTEHGNVETENEVYNLSQFDYDIKFWSHHHNPRSIANNPAGEVTINIGITGPHYCIGAACAAGNAGIIQGVQQLLLNEVDVAIAGGVSESIHTFGIFASFKSQGALGEHEDPTKVSRPFDVNRNGIVVSEGGCLYTLERLSDAKKRGAKIYGEIVSYALNSDASNPVLPNAERQAECIEKALGKGGLTIEDIDLINTHATATKMGDIQETGNLRKLFEGHSKTPYINNTKGFIGHAMGGAGALELAGNLPAFEDHMVHNCLNVDELDPECELPNLVIDAPVKAERMEYILNNSFGMMGINSVVIVKKHHP